MPSSIVAKMACIEPANLAIAQMLGLYEREINMFEHVLDDTPIRTPTCHGAVRAADGRFLLLLEDLSVDYDVGDQVVGATLEQTERVVETLAQMHATWWGKPELAAMTWLPAPNAPQYLAAVPNIYRGGLAVLETEWADRVPPAAIDVARSVDPQFEELLHRTAGGPSTLIHSDTRLDNVFFEKDGDGIAMIDFQLALGSRRCRHRLPRRYQRAARVGSGTLGSDPSALARGDRRSRHHRLPVRRCAAALSRAAMYFLSGAMSLIGTFDAGNDRGASMAEAYSTRILNHVVDIDVWFGALKRRPRASARRTPAVDRLALHSEPDVGRSAHCRPGAVVRRRRDRRLDEGDTSDPVERVREHHGQRIGRHVGAGAQRSLRRHRSRCSRSPRGIPPGVRRRFGSLASPAARCPARWGSASRRGRPAA